MTNSKELQELEELRQQGTARKSAQEFAEIEKKSNEDKVAQDAATKDLEERKAKTSEFKHNPNQEISPVDNLYLAHHKWKNETRKQDREALGIYDKKPDHIIDDDDGDEKQSPTFIIAREHPGSDIPKKEGPEEQLPELAACGCEQCVIS